MKATKFMRIPFFVSGYEVTKDNMDELAKWCEGHVVRGDGDEPFIRVPVVRPTNKKQTEARLGMWVIVSMVRGEPSYKVYSKEWLLTQFYMMPDDAFDALDAAVIEPPSIPATQEPQAHSCTPDRTNVRPLPTQLKKTRSVGVRPVSNHAD